MGGMKRKIPYGVMNWAEVVRECHFVDNTAYIRALEDVKTPVFLRPKRFGKSLWGRRAARLRGTWRWTVRSSSTRRGRRA